MSLRVHYEILNQKGTPAFYSDIFANRPAFGFAGRVFISTDTGAIYEDTGSAWTLIADAGAGTTGTLQQVTTNGNTTSQGIVITAGNLGINTTSPGAPLDIHGTGTNAQFNGTGTNNAYVLFQNAGANKWRLGNNYNAGQNSFDFYSYNAASIAASLNGNGSLLLNFNLGIKQSTGINQVSGYSNIATDSGGFFFNTGGANNAYLNFASLTASRSFTFPDAGGTLALTSQIPAASQWTTNGSDIYFNTGNVGIGLTTPAFPLEVSSTTTSLLARFTSNQANAAIRIVNSSSNSGRTYSIGSGDTTSAAGNNFYIYDETSGAFRFGITPGGNVLIGTTTNGIGKLQVNGQITTNNTGLRFPDSLGTSTWEYGSDTSIGTGVYMYYGVTGYVFTLTSAGVLSTTGGGTSDKRTKENIKYIDTNVLPLIKELKPVSFNFIKDTSKKTRRGFIAQDVLETNISDLVLGDGEKENGTYGLDYDGILSLAIKAIQELNNKLERNNIN